MEEKPRIARVTALMAANAFALIQTMRVVEADPALPPQAVLLALIPAVGIGLAYALLERPDHTVWQEFWAGAPAAAMLVIWMIREALVAR